MKWLLKREKIVKDQLTFACLKSTIEALEKVVKYV